LPEAAARWGCSPADIAGWAAAGRVEIVTGIPPVRAGDRMVGGLIVIPAADLLRLFRRCGTGPSEGLVRRVREQGSTEWLLVTDPPEGIVVATADLLIMGDEVDRFEEECGLKPKRQVVMPAAPSPSKHDWDAFYRALIRRINERGLPQYQQELVAEMRDWFEANSPTGDGPDESTIRKKIAPIWKELRP
jgi:hypothetical protein